MKILEIRILPPIAIGRLGSSETPMDAYGLEINSERPLDFRQVIPKKSFEVDANSGKLKEYLPEKIEFKEVKSIEDKDGKIHPVAPFLEVFAITDEDPHHLVPLTTGLLKKAGLSVKNIKWDVEVANIKLFRRTKDPDDKIEAKVKNITSHAKQPLIGKCKNFLPGKKLPLGHIQFIAPTKEHPEIRFRYTPGPGKVYGSSLERLESENAKPVSDPVITSEEQILYNPDKDWHGYKEGPSADPLYTNPAQIFAGFGTDDGGWKSWGYLDDECDGYVTVSLTTNNKKALKARAHIGAGPPAFAPDTLPVRVISDELEQILLGPDVDEEVSIEEAEEIIRRAFETVRLMNTAVMNGNAVNGRENIASTMVRQDTNDFGRLYEPIMATSIVDNLALRALHERVYNGLATGAAAWFSDVLRRPDKIGDLSHEERRKMPAMMRGADGRALTLTYRHINMVIKAGLASMFEPASDSKKASFEETGKILVTDLVSQIGYRGNGNPFCILPRSAISNCFPGLEYDFRNLWRRAFEGIVLIENNNYVIKVSETYKDLLYTRLVAIDGKPTTVSTSGPVFPGGDSITLSNSSNPNAVSFMEWSNNMASVLQKQGQEVVCHFTAKPSVVEVVAKAEELGDKSKYRAVILKVNKLFEKNSAAFSDDILKPGELTQGLCAPWQNDYRECACYYWAASRPDYVNVVPDDDGLSSGDNWMSKKRDGNYIPDDRKDSRLVSYDDLFRNWEGELNFIIKGFDAIDSNSRQKD